MNCAEKLLEPTFFFIRCPLKSWKFANYYVLDFFPFNSNLAVLLVSTCLYCNMINKSWKSRPVPEYYCMQTLQYDQRNVESL